MDRLRALEVFVAVAELGSFAAAADQLGMSRNMASRHVADLEAHLGARLLNRTTRSVSLSSIGASYLETARDVLVRLEEADRAAGLQRLAPHGRLSLSAPMSFGVRHVAPHLHTFTRANPEVTVDLSLNDRLVDLVEEGFDVAIRIARLADSSLISRRIADVHLVCVASPGYLSEHGTPSLPQDLARHRTIGYSLDTDPGQWRLENASGGQVAVRVQQHITANNGDAIEAMAQSGAGVALQPDFICHESLASGRLVQVLPGWSGGTIGVHALYPGKLYVPLKVRSFIDWLAAFYKTDPPWRQSGQKKLGKSVSEL
jgi:DNA-binding transcriptional LysR family regulator